ncbi:MAG: hypothetical protein EP347_00395 [Alphaproteobacteria bacterium]|nr:MAG: hypothetical protein EP347_00395 [Alphaproteobacteria bacterium]
MRAFKALICNWRKDNRGVSAVILGLTLPVMVGFIGLGAEVGLWYMQHRETQTAADVAAYTGALELRAEKPTSVITSEATVEAQRNGYDSSNGSLHITILSDIRVRANVVQRHPRLFSSLFSNSRSVEITALAEAEYDPGGPACVLALNGSAPDALAIGGNTDIQLIGCNIMSNSTADLAVDQFGSSVVTADCIYATGGISYTANLTTTECSKPIEGAQPIADPYSSVEMPTTYPSECNTIPSMGPSKTVTLSAGRYCSDLVMQGDVTLESGVYIVEGNLQINSGALVNGDQVTFLITGGGVVTFNGSAEINLTASTTGDYAGILVYQDRNYSGLDNVINGNSNSTFTGAIYMPTNHVAMLGSGAADAGCFQLVADTIQLSGDSHFAYNCESTGVQEARVKGLVSIVL